MHVRVADFVDVVKILLTRVEVEKTEASELKLVI